ncbi:dimethyl sulfoxide reductase [Actinobacillus succinogenes]|uniref:DMSO reductase anchor subunit (DmsC) n=1 Tax=Actinobacillus succinogenes (strain ATCC 55618 / DSM 22257 / CCUG 43843 / 130Z) TaxID=339671 RepID=A6VPI2_ACTSZ|nr:DmsC/YnfH family molybdoenzyme membrane anchor subunit [Actinobacillus succinogenes]ABR74879.1 DMSO reductase anchor subunit (DmsC) [Actinobacillus succinogenes 130Z]PHI40711.1 dimethyl sulfoxide reductase [Actinobacillus succinogenes]
MNEIHELPLVIFTVLAQSAAGAWLILTFVLCRHDDGDRAYWNKALFIPLLLLGIGFIASVVHLGMPLRALNSLNRVGSSMLSNEIASGAFFFVLAGGYWLLSLFGKMPQSLGKMWLILTALTGVVFMYMMDRVYHIATVPTWNSSLTSWQFYLTVVIGGSALAYGLLANREEGQSRIPLLYVIGVFLAAIIVIYQGFGLSQIHSSAQQAVALVPDFAVKQVGRLCLLAIAGALLLKSKQSLLLASAVILVLFAEMIGRELFYALHMTVGMAAS